MNILYYIPDLHQGMGGLRQYAIALLRILAADQENQYFVYHQNNDPQVNDILRIYPQLKIVRDASATGHKNLIKAREKLDMLYYRVSGNEPGTGPVKRLCKKYRIDIIHCPYQYLPVVGSIPAICTMHDVQELHFPEYFTAEDRAYRAVHYLTYMRKASGVIVSYGHIKKDLVRYFSIQEQQVHVCLLNMSSLWLDKYGDMDIRPLTELQVPPDFLFYPANTWVHKNHLGILHALVLLREEGFVINVVFTGHQTTYFNEILAPYISAHDLDAQVSFLGIVDEGILYSLYRRCRGVVVPTLYEAGSFPLMEALLLSVPVICSNVTSLPETIGDPEFIFDANTPSAIAGKMLRLFSDEAFRQRNLKNGSIQAGKLRENKALEKIRAVYYNLN